LSNSQKARNDGNIEKLLRLLRNDKSVTARKYDRSRLLH